MDELTREFLIESQEGLDRMDRFDVIFLRNVMPYFSQETRKILLAGIHNVLAPEGMLFLGSSEQSANPSIWTPMLAGGTCHFRPLQPR